MNKLYENLTVLRGLEKTPLLRAFFEATENPSVIPAFLNLLFSEGAEENFYVVELDDTTLKYIRSLSDKFPMLENSLILKEKFCRDAQKYYFCR